MLLQSAVTSVDTIISYSVLSVLPEAILDSVFLLGSFVLFEKFLLYVARYEFVACELHSEGAASAGD